MTSAIILAGGRGERFEGGEKAVAPVAGVPMITRIVDLVDEVATEVVINCRSDQRPIFSDLLVDSSIPIRFAIDSEPDQGPLFGLHTALTTVSSNLAFVVACDMPLVEPLVIEALIDRIDTHDVVVPRLESGWLLPTYAVYRVSPTMTACRRAIERDERNLIAPFRDLDVLEVDPATIEGLSSEVTFENVNTREDLRRVESLLEERESRVDVSSKDDD